MKQSASPFGRSFHTITTAMHRARTIMINPTMYSGRFDDILEDKPPISRAADETAVIYAHASLMGRPGGRPWADAA
jgi:hypothetical protein